MKTLQAPHLRAFVLKKAFASGSGGGFVSAPTKQVVSRTSASASLKSTASQISGSHFASDWRAASSAIRIHRSRFAARSACGMRTIVRSLMTGTIRVTPSSVAFSIVQSHREPLVTQANKVRFKVKGLKFSVSEAGIRHPRSSNLKP